jgi:hypothetical protein
MEKDADEDHHVPRYDLKQFQHRKQGNFYIYIVIECI